MQTRSSSRLARDQSSNPTSTTNPNPKGQNRRRSKQRVENSNLEEHFPPIVTMADQRTMAQLLQAPTEGYEDAIVVPAITADNFEPKHGLLTLVQNKQFKYLLRACPLHGFSELHQLDTFYNALNSKDQDSLNFAAGGNFLDKIPRECLAIIESKFKVRYSRNKPIVAKVSTNTSTSELHQLDTFYNALTPKDQDSLNSDAGCNFLDKMPYLVKALLLDKKGQNQSPALVKAVEESCVTCVGAHSYRICSAIDGNIYRDNIHEYASQASAVNYNQGNTSYRPQMMSNQIRPPGFPSAPAYQAPAPQTQSVSKEDFSAYVKANDAVMKNMQTQVVCHDGPLIPPPVVENEPEATKDTVNPINNGNTEDVQPQVVQSQPVTSEPTITPVSASKPNLKASIPYPSRRNDERNQEKAKDQIEKFYQIFKDIRFEISFADALILMPKFASTLKALIENKEKLSEMARTPLNEHCSTVLLKKLPKKLGDPGKFLIPCDFPGMAECLALAYSVWKRLSLPDLTPTCMTLELADRLISRSVGIAEDVYVKVGSFYFSADFVVVDFDADPRVPLILGRSFLKTGRALIDVFEAKRIDVIDMACEEYSLEVLGFSDTISSGKPTLSNDPIVSATSPTLTPFGNSDFLLEEGDILLLEAFLNDDPSSPPLNQRNQLSEVQKELKMCEAETKKSSVDEPPVVELKALPPHLEYAFLEDDDKLPVIIAKDLSLEEKTPLITVLKFTSEPSLGSFLI
nr:reverse transcriptase domain-containing protein [Tanacetum cinerariifolium]